MHSKQNFLIASLALIGVAGMGAGLFIWPNYRQSATIRQEIAALGAKVAELESQTEVLDRLKQQVLEAQTRVDTEFKYIPESPDLAGLIRTLSQDVDRVNVAGQTFTAGSSCEAITSKATSSETGSGAKTTMMAMPLNVEMDATFDSVFALIRNAEAIERLVRITRVRVLCKRDEKISDPIVLKTSVGLEAIYEMPPSQASSSIASAKEGR